jgi:hypothetical protein
MIPAVIERCAGIDVGRKSIDVCVLVGEAQAEPTEQTRRYSTLNEDVERGCVTGKPYTEQPRAELTTSRSPRLVRHHSHRLRKLSGWLAAYQQRCAPTT